MMVKSKRKLKHRDYTVYRHALVSRIAQTSVVLGMFVTLIIRVLVEAYVYHDLSSSDLIIFVAILVFGSPVLWWAYQIIFVDRLVVTADGIEFYAGSVRGFTTWDNLREFEFVMVGRARNNVIVYENPIVVQANPLSRINGYTAELEHWLPLLYWVRVPCRSIFTGEINLERFKRKPLGKALLHYAPHLFEEEKVK